MRSQRYGISAWCFQTRHGGTDCIPNHREDSGGRTLIVGGLIASARGARTSRAVEGNSLNDESTEAVHPV